MRGGEDGGKGQRCVGRERRGREDKTGQDRRGGGEERTRQDRTSILIHKMLRGRNKAEE